VALTNSLPSCSAVGTGFTLWQPDLRRGQGTVSAGVMVKF